MLQRSPEIPPDGYSQVPATTKINSRPKIVTLQILSKNKSFSMQNLASSKMKANNVLNKQKLQDQISTFHKKMKLITNTLPKDINAIRRNNTSGNNSAIYSNEEDNTSTVRNKFGNMVNLIDKEKPSTSTPTNLIQIHKNRKPASEPTKSNTVRKRSKKSVCNTCKSDSNIEGIKTVRKRSKKSKCSTCKSDSNIEGIKTDDFCSIRCHGDLQLEESSIKPATIPDYSASDFKILNKKGNLSVILGF